MHSLSSCPYATHFHGRHRPSSALSLPTARNHDMRAAILVLALGVPTATASHARDLYDPELVYSYISQAFPGVTEHTGGLSTALWLLELGCYFSNSRQKGEVALQARCWARRPSDGAVVSSSGDVKELILGLINAGLPLDRQSEPGTTYLVARNLQCDRLECKSPDPIDCAGVEVSFECSAD